MTDEPNPPAEPTRSDAPRRPRVSPMLIAITMLVGAIGLAFALVIVARDGDSSSGEKAPAVAPGGLLGNRLPDQLTERPAPRIVLRDADGRTVDSQRLTGRPWLVTFLYTRCPDVCPLIGQQVKQALDDLGPARRDVTALFVSVDPEGDTPEAVQTWLRRQRMPENVRYLNGDAAELEPVWRSYYAEPQNPARPETSTHSAAVWLIDEDGRLRTKHDAGDGVSPEDLAHDLRILLDGQGAASDS